MFLLAMPRNNNNKKNPPALRGNPAAGASSRDGDARSDVPTGKERQLLPAPRLGRDAFGGEVEGCSVEPPHLSPAFPHVPVGRCHPTCFLSLLKRNGSSHLRMPIRVAHGFAGLPIHPSICPSIHPSKPGCLGAAESSTLNLGVLHGRLSCRHPFPRPDLPPRPGSSEQPQEFSEAFPSLVFPKSLQQHPRRLLPCNKPGQTVGRKWHEPRHWANRAVGQTGPRGAGLTGDERRRVTNVITVCPPHGGAWAGQLHTSSMPQGRLNLVPPPAGATYTSDVP
ncbi:uncharacterized protein LOC134150902 isoform X2 [Rhea pennata]|uniref:uncharacterized protein LOC134150902 isoform X2 n=1 Tax=Rhea pennata TaxID=8795 RepID=UPI002E2624C9